MSEQISEIWKGDAFKRQSEAEFLIDFIDGRLAERRETEGAKSFVLNLDAPWGEGKTFFLKRLQGHLVSQGRTVALINAWEDDYAEDPLLAFMDGIERVISDNSAISRETKQSLRNAVALGGELVAAGAKGLFLQAAERYIGSAAIEEIGGALAGEAKDAVDASGKSVRDVVGKAIDARASALLDRFRSSKKTAVNFRVHLAKFVSKLKEEKKAPLYILVDELDRCRPSYAVELLERIKHLFDLEDVAFVVATDSDQLAHAVTAVYGAGFNGRRYLQRFFDQSYTLDRGEKRDFLMRLMSTRPYSEQRFSFPSNNDVSRYMAEGFKKFSFGPRDIQRAYDIFRSIGSAWSRPVPVELVVLFPMIIGHQIGVEPSLSEEFINRLSSQCDIRVPWQLNIDSYSNGQSHTVVDSLQLFKLFASKGETPLKAMFETRPDGWLRWVQHRFHDEFVRLRNSSFDPRSPDLTIMRLYPELIRSAGRVT